jgi:hypothetical protein
MKISFTYSKPDNSSTQQMMCILPNAVNSIQISEVLPELLINPINDAQSIGIEQEVDDALCLLGARRRLGRQAVICDRIRQVVTGLAKQPPPPPTSSQQCVVLSGVFGLSVAYRPAECM